MIILVLIFDLVMLLFIRKKLAQAITGLIQLMGGSYGAAIWVYSLLTLPGVLSHEIAHFLSAALLGLRTGSIEMLPRLEGGAVELGSVSVERNDPFRSSIVGLAPFIAGLAFTAWLSTLLPELRPDSIMAMTTIFTELGTSWQHWLVIYLMTSIALHMIPSAKDMASWPIVAVFVVMISGGIVMMGIKMPVMADLMEGMTLLVNKMSYGLAIVVIATLIWLLICMFGVELLSRLTHRKLLYNRGV